MRAGEVAEGTLERVGGPFTRGGEEVGSQQVSTSHLYVSVGNRAEAIS